MAGQGTFGGSGLLCILRNREDALLPLIIRVGRTGFTLYSVFNSMRLVPTFFGEPGLHLCVFLLHSPGSRLLRQQLQGPGHPPSLPRPFIVPKGSPNRV